MPCYSSIRTKLSNAATLASALAALGYAVTATEKQVIGVMNGGRITFTKTGETFSAQGDTTKLSIIGKKYAETTARDWAKRYGFSVLSSDGTTMKVQNRSGQ